MNVKQLRAHIEAKLQQIDRETQSDASECYKKTIFEIREVLAKTHDVPDADLQKHLNESLDEYTLLYLGESLNKSYFQEGTFVPLCMEFQDAMGKMFALFPWMLRQVKQQLPHMADTLPTSEWDKIESAIDLSMGGMENRIAIEAIAVDTSLSYDDFKTRFNDILWPEYPSE